MTQVTIEAEDIKEAIFRLTIAGVICVKCEKIGCTCLYYCKFDADEYRVKFELDRVGIEISYHPEQFGY